VGADEEREADARGVHPVGGVRGHRPVGGKRHLHHRRILMGGGDAKGAPTTLASWGTGETRGDDEGGGQVAPIPKNVSAMTLAQ